MMIIYIISKNTLMFCESVWKVLEQFSKICYKLYVAHSLLCKAIVKPNFGFKSGTKALMDAWKMS